MMHRGRRRHAQRALCALAAVALGTLFAGAAVVAAASGGGDVVTWVRHPQAAFALTATEVTVAQFRRCVKAGKCDVATVDAENEPCNYRDPARLAHPVNCVSFTGAEQFCAFAGGRVCTEPEWLRACSGTDGRGFPYGDTFDPDACNVVSGEALATIRPPGTVPVASEKRCEGGLPGVFDMAGNVAEWVDACKGTYCKFRGAGHRSNEPVDMFAGCKGVCSGNQKSLQSSVVGIRCCKDVAP